MERVEPKGLSETLEKLESFNKSLCWLGMVLIVGTVGLLIALRPSWRSGQPREIEAQRFVLKDPSGRTRALLELKPDGAPELAFYRDSGEELVSLSALPDDTTILKFERAGRNKLFLSTSSDGSALLNVQNDPWNHSSEVALGSDRFLDLKLRTRGRRMDMTIDPEGTPEIVYKDSNGTPIPTFSMQTEGAPVARTLAQPVTGPWIQRSVVGSGGGGSDWLRTRFAP